MSNENTLVTYRSNTPTSEYESTISDLEVLDDLRIPAMIRNQKFDRGTFNMFNKKLELFKCQSDVRPYFVWSMESIVMYK